jgi:hypothetical protein
MSGWDKARDSGNDLHSNTNGLNNMDPSDDSKVGPSESGGHPPAHTIPRKMATHDGKKESTRSGGVSALVEPSNQDVDFASSTNVSSHCAIEDLDERKDLGELPEGSSDKSTGGDRPSDTTHGNQISGDKHGDDQFQSDNSQHVAEGGSSDKDKGHQVSNDEHQIGQLQDKSKHERDVESASSDQGQQGNLQEYDAESRTYHAFYDEVSASTYPFEHPADSSSLFGPILEATTPGVVSTA